MLIEVTRALRVVASVGARPVGAALRRTISDCSIRCVLLVGVYRGLPACMGSHRVSWLELTLKCLDLASLEAGRAERLRHIVSLVPDKISLRPVVDLLLLLLHTVLLLCLIRIRTDRRTLQLHLDLKNLALQVLIGLF